MEQHRSTAVQLEVSAEQARVRVIQEEQKQVSAHRRTEFSSARACGRSRTARARTFCSPLLLQGLRARRGGRGRREGQAGSVGRGGERRGQLEGAALMAASAAAPLWWSRVSPTAGRLAS